MSALVLAILAGLLACVGAVLLYLASPNQRWTGAAVPGRRLAVGGAGTLVLSLALLLGLAGPATAIFIWMALAMTMWSIVPLAVAWRRRRGAAR